MKTKEDYQKMLTETILETAGYISQFPEMGIYKTIGDELKKVGDVLYKENRLPTFVEQKLPLFGAIAVKNFTDDNPGYAKKLIELYYYFEHYSELV